MDSSALWEDESGIMAWTRAKIAVAAGAGLLLAAIAVKKIYDSVRYYSWQVQYANDDILDKTPPQVAIVPARFSSNGGLAGHDGKIMGIGQPIETILQIAYGVDQSRLVFSAQRPSGKYDFIANLPQDNAQALREEIEKTFDLNTRKEKREMDVLLLGLKRRNAAGLRSTASPKSSPSSEWLGDQYHCVNVPLSTLTGFLDQRFNVPVVDQTALGGKYDIDISWRHSYPDTLKQAVIHDLGLELSPGRKQVEILVVEKK
jgi:uncharacterized protein (TIGR03435 family)